MKQITRDELERAARKAVGAAITDDEARAAKCVRASWSTEEIAGSEFQLLTVTSAYDDGFLDGADEPTGNYGEVGTATIEILPGSAGTVHVRQRRDGKERWWSRTSDLARELEIEVKWNALDFPAEIV